MKRTIATISLFLAALFTSYAATVSSQRAAATAAKFLNVDKPVLAWSGEASKDGLSSPSFYVFDNPDGGWVVISADDALMPVLAYSDEGSFCSEGMPAQVSSWFSRMDRVVKSLRSPAAPAAPAVKARWDEPRVRLKGASETLLKTASWGQDSPYNASIAGHVGSKGLITGCVATATAILMRYYCWPEKPVGTIPAYKTETGRYSVPQIPLDGLSYDWDKMPLTSAQKSSWTSAQKTAVADLMLHCGAMVKMDYGRDASSAYSNDIAPALYSHMSYDNCYTELYRQFYTDQEWLGMIRKEIEGGSPLIYGGSDFGDGGGHQFILDGVNDDNFVHVNWGWEGDDNGWFACNYLGSKSMGYVFSVEDSAIFGIRPLKSGTATGDCPGLFLYAADSYQGISLLSGRVGKGTFRLKIGYLMLDNEEYGYNGPVRICLADYNGNIRETLCEGSVKIDKAKPGMYSGSGLNSVNCAMTSEPILGDYISIYYKHPAGEWLRIGSDFFEASSQCTDRYGVVDVPVICVPTTIRAGKVLYPYVIPGARTIKEVSWSCDGSSVDRKLFTPSSGSHTLRAVIKYKDGGTDTLIRKIKVD